MSNCQHRWEPTNFGIKTLEPGNYWFACTRCHKTIFAQLTGKL